MLKNFPRFLAALVVFVTISLEANAQPFLPGNVAVVQVGADGSTSALSNASTAVFIKQYTPVGIQVGSTLSLPTATNGANASFTMSGSATSEGSMALSGNGQFLTLAGYDAAPGVTGIAGTTTTAVNRVGALINIQTGTIDTSTRVNALFSGNNVRTAVTNDGTQMWLAGGNSGVVTLPVGTTGGTTITAALPAAPTNIRTLNITNGQLYGSSGSGNFTNVFTVGTGLPTTTGQTATILPGFPTTGASPYAFTSFDMNPGVPGIDRIYVADDRAVASGGGVQKWDFDGTTWLLTATHNTAAFRGVSGYVVGTDVVLFGTTAVTGPNSILTFTDNGVNFPTTPDTLVAMAPTNTAFRGLVAFAPAPVPEPALIGLAAVAMFAGLRRKLM